MKRLVYLFLSLVVGALLVDISNIIPRKVSISVPKAQAQSLSKQAPLRDDPPDTTEYTRNIVPEDYAPGGRNPLNPVLFVRDTVVSNTDPTLAGSDTFNDSEPSIAINPENTNEIVITAFSGGWGSNAPIWHTTDGGSTWTKRFTVPIPPGVPSAAGCPCDQTVDYGRFSRLFGSFLSANPYDVYSGVTTNPKKATSWQWFLSGGVAQKTNSFGIGNSDQPWLLMNRDPVISGQDNAYVAYDDFVTGGTMRVAVAPGSSPPNFVRDNASGASSGSGVNPGHRLAGDSGSGFMYSIFQSTNGAGAGGTSYNIAYHLNRSTDGGVTWVLNGNPGGIVVANADSTQGCSASDFCPPPPAGCQPNNFKFGTVNALLGGVDHAAVDPNNGDVYYVYGNRDPLTGNNRLSIVRLTSNGSGGLNIGAPTFVTGQVQAALPSVAIATNGTLGVLYDTFDGFSGGFPMFTAHLGISTDQGLTFSDNVLEAFLSPAADSGYCRQRVLGDYQQVKSRGNTFYGVFTGSGVPFGRSHADDDPIFFKVDAPAGGPPPANQAVSLNGSTAYVDVPGSTSLDITSAITVEAWINTNTVTPQQSIMERYSPTGGGFALRLDGSNKVVFFTLANSGSGDAVQGNTSIPINGWHHVAGVYDGTELRIYVDGNRDSNPHPSTFNPAAGNSSVKIGARGDDSTFKFSGFLDECRLTAGALYSSNFTLQPCLSTAAGTKGLWKFDNQTAADSSGNNNNGTLVGPVGFVAGQSCTAPSFFSLALDGTGYVDVPSSTSLNITGAITVEAWINTNTVTAQQGIMERYSFTGGGFALRLDGSNKVVFFTLANSGSGDAVQGNTSIPINGWHHVAGVYDGTELRIYVDGNRDSNPHPSTFNPAAGNSSVKIGARGDDSTFKLSGFIDECRLTAAALYNSNFTPDHHPSSVSGTKGLWKFDNQTAADSSGNNNNGTAVGGASYSPNIP